MKTSLTLSTMITLIVLGISGFSFSNDQNTPMLTLKIVTVKFPSCNSASDGMVEVQAEGGKAPYSYNWNTYPAQHTPMAVNLKSGVYFIEVKDAQGTIFFQSIEVKAAAEASLTSVQLVTDPTGTEVNTNDNQLQYELNGEKIEDLSHLQVGIGIHEIKITNGQGCQSIQYLQVMEDGNGGTDAFLVTTEVYINQQQNQLVISKP